MNGKRIKRKQARLFLNDILKELKSFKLKENSIKEEKANILARQRACSGKTKHFQPFNLISAVNLKIIHELGNKVLLNKKSSFVIIDSFQFNDETSPPLQFASNWLKILSEHSRFGYIPLYKELNESKENGNSPQWKHDSHFNEVGNKIFAKSMFEYLANQLN